MNKRNLLRVKALCVGLVLGIALGGGNLNLSGSVSASGLQDSSVLGEGGVVGIASNGSECLSVGGDVPGPSLGFVRLAWQGHVEGARLVLGVAGTEAAHTIKVNGWPAALAPVHPGGRPCSDDEYVILDIPPELVVNGENRIEITDDARPGDAWTAANVRLEVFGELAVPQVSSADDSGQPNQWYVASTAQSTIIFDFINSYDGTTQQAIAQIPDGYDPGTPAPLLVAVHARFGTKEKGLDWFDEEANARGWLLASPELHGSWTPDPSCYDPGVDCDYDDKVLTELGIPGAYAYASLESQYDVIGTVDYMVQTYNVNPNRIYLAGYSMGGQADVIIAAKFPHLFAAVFDNKGPTDMVEWYDEQAIYYDDPDDNNVRAMRKECHIGGDPKTPAENPFCYQRRSGIRFTSNYVHIPISMTHSVSDALVPIHHSRDLRDAINGYGPDQPASLFEDTLVTCSPDYHCYEPDPEDVLDFLEPFTLNNNPTYVNVATDESKFYYWMNLAQTGGDHWSQVEAAYDPISATVAITVTDAQPLTVGLNLGETPVMDIIEQPGMGLPATTYLVKGGGNNALHRYVSGYLTTTVGTTGLSTFTISAVDAALAADPAMISGWEAGTSTITAVLQDRLNNPVPAGTAVRFSASEGTFPNASSTYTTAIDAAGRAAAILTLPPYTDPVNIVASAEGITASTQVGVIYPAVDVQVTPDREAMCSGEAVTYTYQITNTGDIVLTGVTVVDDNGTLGNHSDDFTVCAYATLPAGAMDSCLYTKTLTRTTINTAVITGWDPLGHDVTSSDSALVVVVDKRVYLAVVILNR